MRGTLVQPAATNKETSNMRFVTALALVLAPLWITSCACRESSPAPAAPTAAAPTNEELGAALMPKPERYPEQDVLKFIVGEWDVENTMWMDPSQPPHVSKGICSTKLMSPNEYWAIADYKSSMFGTEFSGHSVFGYDITQKKWVGTWIDSMAPVIMNSVSEWDSKTKTWTAMSEFIDPGSSQTMKFRMTTEVKSMDNHFFTMYLVTPEGEMKNMTINYTRRK